MPRGFVAGQEVVPAANVTLRGVFAGRPVAAFAVGLLLLGYRLDESEHARIRKELTPGRQATV